MRKGQYIRLLLATTADPTTVIAAAKEMQLHLSASTENSTTKDSTGDWEEYEVTAQTYDISGSALILTPSDALNTSAVSLNDMITNLSDTTLYWRICLMEGTNNRSIDEEICSGTAKLTSLEMSGQVGQTAQYSYTLSGSGTISTT